MDKKLNQDGLERKKVLGFWDLALFSFCAIFGLEAIATSAAIGPSAMSWWLICLVGYFLPFGLISAELGAAYPEQGGIYVWIKRACGKKWATRSVWYYWISLPIWLPAIYIAIADILGQMFFPGISLSGEILIGVILIWIAVLINLWPLGISKWIPNIGAIAQLVIVLGMIMSAIAYFLKNGHLANEISVANMMPNLNAAIVFIPVIIYNLLGCELISASAGEMKNSARDVPKALIMCALAIALLYMITIFAFWVVVPAGEINIASGILQVFVITFSDSGSKQAMIMFFGLLIALAFFAGIVTWNLGQNRTVAESANNGDLPKILGKMTRDMAPIGASLVSGIISTTVIVVYGFIAKNASELFWHMISFSLIVGLFSYLMLFPAFIILRRKDKNISRPYRIPGPDGFAIFLAIMAETFIVLAVSVLIIQPGHDFMRFAVPIIAGVLMVVVIGEVFVARALTPKGV